MISLNDALTRLSYNILEGRKFNWDLFGPNAHTVLFTNSSIIFDRVTHEIYIIRCNPLSYGGHHEPIYWVNEKYEVAYRNELRTRGVRRTESGDQVFCDEAMLRICEMAELKQPIDTDLLLIVQIDIDQKSELHQKLSKIADSKMISVERLIEQLLESYQFDDSRDAISLSPK